MSFYSLIKSVETESSLLVKDYYPDFSFQRKVNLVKKAVLAHEGENCTITISRCAYADAALPASKGNTEVVCADHYFDYAQDTDARDRKVWYVSFTDPALFVAYASDLFAQDEIQTLEMPLLAAAEKYLINEKIPGLEPITVPKGEPTPLSDSQMEIRICMISTKSHSTITLISPKPGETGICPIIPE